MEIIVALVLDLKLVIIIIYSRLGEVASDGVDYEDEEAHPHNDHHHQQQ